MATPLIPQEVYLLEHYSSKAYFVLIRDAWEDMVKHVEHCLSQFVDQLPANYRGRPQPAQPDIVWGEIVLPNFRSTLLELQDSYIRLTHGEMRSLDAAHGVANDIRGQRDFSTAWFDEVEVGAFQKYSDLLHTAGRYADPIWRTAGAYWIKGGLTDRYNPDSRGPLPDVDAWPKYRLNSSVTVQTGDPVPRTGIYLPEIDDSCAQFLIAGDPADKANVGYDPKRMQNVSREPTRWTLVERVPGETIPLSEGLGPVEAPPLRLPAGKECSRAGYWFTPAKQNSRRYFKQGDVFPEIEGSSYGATFWQWSPDQSVPSL